MLRPQPIDLGPWPFGGLVLPDVPGAPEFAVALARGETPEVPAGLAFWEQARRDDGEAALLSLRDQEGAVAAYNRLVLDPGPARLEEARAAVGDDAELAALTEVAAFKCGLREDLPDVTGLGAELLASAQAAAATAAAEAGDLARSRAALERGIAAARDASPALAAHLALSMLEVLRLGGAPADEQVAHLRAADAALPEAPGFSALRGELRLELGITLQESAGHDRRRIVEASGLFQDAAARLDPETHRRAHGFAQMRLGISYLSMPMRDAGDALRMGVATQSLRRALEVFDEAREPELWCAAATNLANAFQLLPSGHQADNLREGIELYDRALALRGADDDPGGRARLLMNKAQAAASLEDHRVAIAALEEACPLLQELRLPAELNAARHMMEDLKRQLTTAGGPA